MPAGLCGWRKNSSCESAQAPIVFSTDRASAWGEEKALPPPYLRVLALIGGPAWSLFLSRSPGPPPPHPQPVAICSRSSPDTVSFSLRHSRLLRPACLVASQLAAWARLRCDEADQVLRPDRRLFPRAWCSDGSLWNSASCCYLCVCVFSLSRLGNWSLLFRNGAA